MMPRTYLPALALLACLAAACKSPHPPDAPVASPRAQVRPAPLVQFRGANSESAEKPGDCDCNNPLHWSGDTLHVFNSAGHPWRSSGPGLFQLNRDYVKSEYDKPANGGRWIECTWMSDTGELFGWYHLEPTGICPGSHPVSPQLSLTAPRIGAVKSADNGAHWEDLGVVLDATPILRCDTKNYYFAGGNGDFSVMLDRRQEYLYFLISTYSGETAEQGVAIARMRWKDRHQPVGRVFKWHQGAWAQPGLGGQATPVFPAKTDWHRADADAFWGPSIHWNTHLRRYVMLLNRSRDSHWTQEGIYASYNADLANPAGWSAPEKIMDAPGNDRWYPQVAGTDASKRETDKLAGQTARLFVRGVSRWEIRFCRPGER